jgi:putative transposase
VVDAKIWKDIALTFAGNLVTAGWSAVKACAIVGVHRTSWYRHLNPPARAGITVPHADRDYPNRITTAEADEFMGLLNSEEYANLSVTQAYYRMLDAGHCLFSVAAAHRIVARHGQNGDRRAQRSGSGPKRAKPVLEATDPNQLWSWDITMLHGPGKHTYRLYTIMDVFSRKVVGHRVEYTETAALASALIRDAVADNNQTPAILHADNGAPMRAATTLDLARSLGITLSYSRPRISDDNPYSESLFKTVKYDLDFPRRFQDLQHAREHMSAFFTGYNTHHRHSGLNYYTPDTVHHGLVRQARQQRQETLDACYARNPHRYRHRPAAPEVPSPTGINNKETTPLSQTA